MTKSEICELINQTLQEEGTSPEQYRVEIKNGLLIEISESAIEGPCLADILPFTSAEHVRAVTKLFCHQCRKLAALN